MSTKTDILRSYRELVFLARRLPKEKQLQALTQAKLEIRANKDEPDQGKASDMHKKLVGKVGFLRMTLPKQRDRYTTSGTFVLRDGTLVEDTAYRENRYSVSLTPCGVSHPESFVCQFSSA